MFRPSAFILRRERVVVNRLSNRRANVLAVRTQRSFASGPTETAELALKSGRACLRREALGATPVAIILFSPRAILG